MTNDELNQRAAEAERRHKRERVAIQLLCAIASGRPFDWYESEKTWGRLVKEALAGADTFIAALSD